MAQGQKFAYITLKRGKKEQGRQHIVYADLRDAETHELLISATREYVVNALKERDIQLVLGPNQNFRDLIDY